MMRTGYSKKILNFISLGLIFLAPGFSAASTSRVQVKDKFKPSSSLSIGATHYAGFNEDVDQYTELGASVSLKLMKDHSLSIRQLAYKVYDLNPGQAELQAVDTKIGYSYKVWSDVRSTSGSLKLGATLPVSEFSRDNDVITKTSIGFSFATSLMDKKLSLALTPSASYKFNRYKVTQTGEGKAGGNPLVSNSLGIAGSATYRFTDKLSSSLAGGYSRVAYEQPEHENNVSKLGQINLPKHVYSYGISFDYAWTKQLSTSLGMSHLEKIEKAEGATIYAFDELSTEWFAAAALSF